MVMSTTPVRSYHLVAPLTAKVTAMRTTDTADGSGESGAVSRLIARIFVSGFGRAK